MTMSNRIASGFRALLSILSAYAIFRLGEDGAVWVCFLLSMSLVLFGLRNLYFYWTMARHMVDGRSILYLGVIVFDVGILSLSLTENRGVFIALFLLRSYAFSGGMDILRALESRRLQAPSWRLSLTEGVINIAFAAGGLVFGLILGDMKDLTMVYAVGLLYTAVMQLINAFRRTAIVYIP